MKKTTIVLIIITAYLPLYGITITFKQVGDASQRERIIERTFSEPVRRGCVEAMTASSLTYVVNSSNKTVTLELDPKDLIIVSTYVEQRPYIGEWALQNVRKKFRVTQGMHNNVIELNKADYKV